MGDSISTLLSDRELPVNSTELIEKFVKSEMTLKELAEFKTGSLMKYYNDPGSIGWNFDLDPEDAFNDEIRERLDLRLLGNMAYNGLNHKDPAIKKNNIDFLNNYKHAVQAIQT